MAVTMFRKSVALEQTHIEVVEDLAARKGLGVMGFSAALRMIISEWMDAQKENIRITEAGRQALAEARAGSQNSNGNN